MFGTSIVNNQICTTGFLKKISFVLLAMVLFAPQTVFTDITDSEENMSTDFQPIIGSWTCISDVGTCEFSGNNVVGDCSCNPINDITKSITIDGIALEQKDLNDSYISIRCCSILIEDCIIKYNTERIGEDILMDVTLNMVPSESTRIFQANCLANGEVDIDTDASNMKAEEESNKIEGMLQKRSNRDTGSESCSAVSIGRNRRDVIWGILKLVIIHAF